MVNKTHETALVYAAYYDHSDICLLLKNECGIMNEFGEYAITYGVTMNNPKVVRVLFSEEGRLLTRENLSLK